MAVYQYTASSLNGKMKRGQLAAANPEQLKAALREKQLFLITYAEKEQRTRMRKLSALELSDFCRELSSLLSSGVTVVRSLTIISARNMPAQMRTMYGSISSQLKRGVALSDAMELQGRAFPEMLLNMIRAGEASGKLDKTFEKMAEHYQKEHRLTNSVKSAMTYPMVLLVLLIAVVIGLFTFVLPKFFPLFEGMQLPLLTRVVMAISDGISEHWFLIILCAAFLGVSIYTLLQLHKVRRALDKVKLRIPKVGKLLRIIYTAQFSRTLASLYNSGMSIISSLNVAKSTLPNFFIRDQFDDIIRKVRSGNALSAALSECVGFDPKLAQTVAVGEETGKLDAMLNSTADSFDYESQEAIKKIITILEPLMIIIMALLVLVVIGAVMLPIYTMYGNVESRY